MGRTAQLVQEHARRLYDRVRQPGADARVHQRLLAELPEDVARTHALRGHLLPPHHRRDAAHTLSGHLQRTGHDVHDQPERGQEPERRRRTHPEGQALAHPRPDHHAQRLLLQARRLRDHRRGTARHGRTRRELCLDRTPPGLRHPSLQHIHPGHRQLQLPAGYHPGLPQGQWLARPRPSQDIPQQDLRPGHQLARRVRFALLGELHRGSHFLAAPEESPRPAHQHATHVELRQHDGQEKAPARRRRPRQR